MDCTRALGLNPYDIRDRSELNHQLGSLAQHRESYYINCWYLHWVMRQLDPSADVRGALLDARDCDVTFPGPTRSGVGQVRVEARETASLASPWSEPLLDGGNGSAGE